MVKIQSFSNHEEYFCFGMSKEQELIPKLREFIEELGENFPEGYFKRYEDERTQGGTVDDNIQNLQDEAKTFELDDCIVFLFFGKDKLFVAAAFDKEKREKVLGLFNRIFNPEQ